MRGMACNWHINTGWCSYFGTTSGTFMQVERENSNLERSLGPPSDSKQSPNKDKAAAVNGNSSSDTHQEAIASTSRAVQENPVAVPPARILEPPKLEPPSTPRKPTSVAPLAPVQVCPCLLHFLLLVSSRLY